jgi:hypothetical protein
MANARNNDMMMVMKKLASRLNPQALAAAIAIVRRATNAIRGAQILVQVFSSASRGGLRSVTGQQSMSGS